MRPRHRINIIDQCAHIIWDTKTASKIPPFLRALGIKELSQTDPSFGKKDYVRETLAECDDKAIWEFSKDLLDYYKHDRSPPFSGEFEQFNKCKSDLERTLAEMHSAEESKSLGLKQLFYGCKYKPDIIINANGFMSDRSGNSLDYRGSFSASGVTVSDIDKYFLGQNRDQMEIARFCGNSMQVECEILFYHAYFVQFIKPYLENKNSAPIALLPQVYLNWDPFTKKQRGYKLVNQKVDFLWYGPNHFPLVIEIDGPSHWEFPDVGYRVQCEFDRDLMDRGFHIRRFTNDEIRSWHSQNRLEEEVKSLFSRYLRHAKNKSVA